MAAWWSRPKSKKKPEVAAKTKRSVPSGVFQKCDECGETVPSGQVKEAMWCCPQCGHHFVMPTEERIKIIVDEGSLRRGGSDDPARGSARLPRLQALRRSPARGAEAGRRWPTRFARAGDDRRAAGVDRLLRVRVHGRVDGLGRRREDHAAVRARARRAGARRSCSTRRAARACRRASSRSCRWRRRRRRWRG